MGRITAEKLQTIIQPKAIILANPIKEVNRFLHVYSSYAVIAVINISPNL